MKKTENLSSLKLDKPAVAMPRGSAAFAVFFYALLLFLADAGAMGLPFHCI